MDKATFQSMSGDAQRVIERMARRMKNDRFDSIPSVLFQKHTQAQYGEHDTVLQLIGGERMCCECGSTDLTQIEDDDEHGDWFCEDCDADAITCAIDYDNLRLSGPEHGWPSCRTICHWTTDWNGDDAFVKAANAAGFHVYEAQDFEGYILAIDGGGYNFMNDHWIPLYLALGFEWHTREHEWPGVSDEIMLSQKLKIHTGPCDVHSYVELFAEIFGHEKVFAGTEHVYICGMSAPRALHEMNNRHMIFHSLTEMVEEAEYIGASRS